MTTWQNPSSLLRSAIKPLPTNNTFHLQSSPQVRRSSSCQSISRQHNLPVNLLSLTLDHSRLLTALVTTSFVFAFLMNFALSTWSFTFCKLSPPLQTDFLIDNHCLPNPLRLTVNLSTNFVKSWTQSTTSIAGLLANYSTMSDGWVMKAPTRNISGLLLQTSPMLMNSLKNSTNVILPNPVLIYSPLIMTIALPIDNKPSSDARLLENRHNPSFLSLGFNTHNFFWFFLFLLVHFVSQKDSYKIFWNFQAV